MRKVLLLIVIATSWMSVAKAQPAPELKWDFTNSDQITASHGLSNLKIADGKLSAFTGYDPYFLLTLPQKEIDAKAYHYLSVKLYSSMPADKLSVYYKSPNGDWSIGATPFAVQKGWHNYVVDLDKQITWSQDASSPAARVWGGTTKLISTLRLDPGNQADRNIIISDVTLSANPIIAPPITEWHWEEANDLLGWTPGNFETTQVVNGALQGATKYDSQLLSPILNLNAEDWTDAEFRVKSSVNGSGEIFFRHTDEGMSDKRQVSFTIVGDGKYHTYRVNLSSDPAWNGTIAQVRFDPIDPATPDLAVQYFRFLPKNTGGLIGNGGFELQDEKSLPEGWFFGHSVGSIVSGENSANALEWGTGLSSGDLNSSIFEFPETGQYQLSLDYKNIKYIRSITAQVDFYDVFHQPLTTQHLNLNLTSSSSWQELKSTFDVPRLAAYGQLIFTLPSMSGVTLDNVSINPISGNQQTINPWEERWRANWIVAPGAEAQPNAPRYFRHEFAILDTTKVTSAKLKVTADNTVRVSINGKELPAGANWNEWKLLDVYDLQPYLKNGKNVIGIITQNQGSAEGLLAELNVLQPSGAFDLNSDKSWKSSVGKVDEDWSKSTFDDSAWQPAQELGTPPIQPWNEVPYVYLGERTPLKLTAFNAPKQAKLGESIHVNLSVIPQSNTFHPTALKLSLIPLGATSDESSYGFSLVPLDTSKWQKDIKVELHQSVQLPKYFQPGKYFLSANLTYADMMQGSVASKNQITLTQPTIAKSPVTKVVYLPGNVPSFEINGKTFPVMHSMTGVPDAVKNSHDNGVNLIWLNIADGFDWEPDAPATFSAMDKRIAGVLNANPDAYVVLNVPLDPVYNPGMRKWVGLHPDQLVKKDDGSTNVGGYHGAVVKGQSYASPVWKQDAGQAWRELIRHVRSSSYADRVIGYVPISGISWEWFYWGAQSKEFVDYSKPFTQAFANWAKEQYHGDLALLNKSWNTNFASFDAIQLPSKDERSGADFGVFLDPQKRGEVIDLRQFFTQVISGDILNFCHIVKEETNGNAICGTYYGYVMYIGGPYFGVHSGHYALGKVLSSPDIDFIMSPSRYADRGLGGGSGFMTAVDSVKLHKKLYIDQDDVRTFRATGPGGQLARLNTIKDTVSVLKREFSNTAVNGVAAQWYDFDNGWIMGDKRLMQLVGKTHQIETLLQHTPRETMDAPNSIAVILNEKSILYTKVDSMIQDAVASREIDQLNRSGVAWDNYLLSDLPKIGKYHYYLFLNCFNLTDEQKLQIENLKKDGNVLVFIGTPGIIDQGDKSTFAQAQYNPAGVSKVTGFDLKQIADGPLVTVIQSDNSLAQNLAGKTFGDSSVTGPRFAAQDGVKLGHFNDNDETSLAIKKFADWTSIYSAAPTLPAGLLRNIARLANVPVVNNYDGDITYVSKNLFAVHSLTGGEREFTVGKQYQTAKELFSDRVYSVTNGQFEMQVPEAGTVLFLLQ
jgi:hypothetical protein